MIINIIGNSDFFYSVRKTEKIEKQPFKGWMTETLSWN